MTNGPSILRLCSDWAVFPTMFWTIVHGRFMVRVFFRLQFFQGIMPYCFENLGLWPDHDRKGQWSELELFDFLTTTMKFLIERVP
jgi:hypothetical protein